MFPTAISCSRSFGGFLMMMLTLLAGEIQAMDIMGVGHRYDAAFHLPPKSKTRDIITPISTPNTVISTRSPDSANPSRTEDPNRFGISIAGTITSQSRRRDRILLCRNGNRASYFFKEQGDDLKEWTLKEIANSETTFEVISEGKYQGATVTADGIVPTKGSMGAVLRMRRKTFSVADHVTIGHFDFLYLNSDGFNWLEQTVREHLDGDHDDASVKVQQLITKRITNSISNNVSSSDDCSPILNSTDGTIRGITLRSQNNEKSVDVVISLMDRRIKVTKHGDGEPRVDELQVSSQKAHLDYCDRKTEQTGVYSFKVTLGSLLGVGAIEKLEEPLGKCSCQEYKDMVNCTQNSCVWDGDMFSWDSRMLKKTIRQLLTDNDATFTYVLSDTAISGRNPTNFYLDFNCFDKALGDKRTLRVTLAYMGMVNGVVQHGKTYMDGTNALGGGFALYVSD